MSDENFYRFCLSQAEAQGKPLIFRTGGGKNLGILGADDALHTPRLRTWIVHGAPKAWDQEDLLSFLKANSWNQPAIITRRKSWSKGSPPEWLFGAFAPTGASDDIHFAYADEASYVTVVPEGPRAKNKPVSGLRKKWVDAQHERTAGPTQIDYDSDLDSANAEGADENDRLSRPVRSAKGLLEGRERSRSPVKDPKPKNSRPPPGPPDPDSILLRDASGWTIKEAGGRETAVSEPALWLWERPSPKTYSAEEAKREGAKLRLYAIAHLRKHSESCRVWFAVDTDESSQAWAGHDAPKDYDSFVSTLARAGVWIDNLSLTALAERTGVAIVTWVWDDCTSTWYRSVAAPWFKDQVVQCAKRLKPIVLVLRAKHYRALIPDSDVSCPEEWLRKTDWVPAHALRGAGKSLSLLPSTPAKSSRTGRSLSVLSSTPKRSSSCAGLSVPPCTPGRSSKASSRKGSQPKANSSRSHVQGSGKLSSARTASLKAPSSVERSVQVSCAKRPKLQSSNGCHGNAKAPRAAPSKPGRIVTSKPEPVGLPKLPLHPVQDNLDPPCPKLWWTCEVPGCNFQVFQKPGLQGHSDRRRVHLRDAHGISKQIDSCDIGWARCFANLQSKGWWPGAHSIAEAKPSAWREYKSKENTYWRPLHRCSKCDRLVSRSELTSSPCPNADAPLAPKVASRIWKG